MSSSSWEKATGALGTTTGLVRVVVVVGSAIPPSASWTVVATADVVARVVVIDHSNEREEAGGRFGSIVDEGGRNRSGRPTIINRN